MTQASDASSPSCPECGAPEVDGLDCWSGQLGQVLAWESGNPELQAVHFLTVACYNLQHPSLYTDEALAELGKLLGEALDHDLPPHEIRRRIGSTYEGSKRVRRPESERRPVLRRWPMTVADVTRPGDPEGAADRVRVWAAAVRQETERGG